MGWSYGVTPEGREVGYGVEATCDLDGCEATIDRGLGYLCGQMHGEQEDGRCGGYFCMDHLYFGTRGQQCVTCNKHEGEPDTDCAHPFPDQVGQTLTDEVIWRCDECRSVYVDAPTGGR